MRARVLAALALAASVPAQGEEPPRLALSLREAVLGALAASPALKVQVLNVASRLTVEQEERAAFDPIASTGVTRTWNPTSPTGVVGPDETQAQGKLSVSLPSGTVLGATASQSWAESASSAVELSVTQSLLRGASPAANLARVRQARLDAFSSRYELAAFAAGLVADVEIAYWDLYVARRQLEITRESLALARRQLEETRARVEIGRLAEIEIAAAEAEVASRQDAVLAAEARVESARVRLVRLIDPPGAGRWGEDLGPSDAPEPPAEELEDVNAAVRTGLAQRPDLAQARLALEKGELEVVRTRNGLLPKLEAYFTAGSSARGDSAADSWAALGEQPLEVTAGIRLEVPLGNRAAAARSERAAIGRQQGEEALRNLELAAEAEIRTAHVEARRARRQIESTAAVETLQRQKLEAETEKFRVGTSTAFLVAQAQRDLLAAQLSAVQASAGYLQALVRLYRAEGTLLARRGIEVSDAGVGPGVP